jgi:hypothetical protein
VAKRWYIIGRPNDEKIRNLFGDAVMPFAYLCEPCLGRDWVVDPDSAKTFPSLEAAEDEAFSLVAKDTQKYLGKLSVYQIRNGKARNAVAVHGAGRS